MALRKHLVLAVSAAAILSSSAVFASETKNPTPIAKHGHQEKTEKARKDKKSVHTHEPSTSEAAPTVGEEASEDSISH